MKQLCLIKVSRFLEYVVRRFDLVIHDNGEEGGKSHDKENTDSLFVRS
jgi:hypothetical protein